MFQQVLGFADAVRAPRGGRERVQRRDHVRRYDATSPAQSRAPRRAAVDRRGPRRVALHRRSPIRCSSASARLSSTSSGNAAKPARCSPRLHGAAFPGGHPYRARLGGDEASVAAITRAQACAFADAHYAPNNAVLVVSGNLTADQLQTSLKKFLTHLTRREITPQVALPPPRDERCVEHRRAGRPRCADRDLAASGGSCDACPRARDRRRCCRAWRIRRFAAASRSSSSAISTRPCRARRASRERRVRRRGRHGRSRRPLEALGATFLDVGRTPRARIRSHAAARDLSPVRIARARLRARCMARVRGARRSNPTATLADEFRGLRELHRDGAVQVVSRYLRLDRGQVTVLKANGPARGRDAELAAAIHDLGQRRDPPIRRSPTRRSCRHPTAARGGDAHARVAEWHAPRVATTHERAHRRRPARVLDGDRRRAERSPRPRAARGLHARLGLPLPQRPADVRVGRRRHLRRRRLRLHGLHRARPRHESRLSPRGSAPRGARGPLRSQDGRRGVAPRSKA